MTELRGSLKGIGLPALVRLLAGLRKSGCLHLGHDRWGGEIYLEEGRVVAAEFGADRGAAALDALVLALPESQFAFAEGERCETRDHTAGAAGLQAHLDELMRRRTVPGAAVPSPAAVPRISAALEQPPPVG
ncbi:MAG: DUF4388 domain-containing protein, partial [Chloroflexota bacterium]